MVSVAIVLLTFYISIHDLRTHTISNKSSATLLIILMIDPHPDTLLLSAVSMIGLIFLSILIDLGGGDFKLFAVLLISQGKVLLSSNYGLLFGIATTITLIAYLTVRGNLQGSIPLGPAILAPFTITYLAI